MAVRVVCINKDNGNHENPHLAIEFFGWVNEQTNEQGKNSRDYMVNYVENGGKVYVKDSYGRVAYCEVRTSINGNKFLQTITDGVPTDNLLKLQECR